jgi:uncharacterized protein YukE
MAKLSGGHIEVDTNYLRRLAGDIKTTADSVRYAGNCANNARRHSNWRCGDRYNVTNEVDNIHLKARKIADDMDNLAEALKQGADDFEAMQSAIISTLSVAELKSI